MTDPTALHSDDFAILAVRELRKSGLDLVVGRPRRRVFGEGDDVRGDDYLIDMEGVLRAADVERRVMIECRRERVPVGAAAVRALREVAIERGLQCAILFSASGFEQDALREGRSTGIALLALTDGRAAFARSGYGSTSAPAPTWVPEFMAEVVELDVAGVPRQHLIVAGAPALILERLRILSSETSTDQGGKQ